MLFSSSSSSSSTTTSMNTRKILVILYAAAVASTSVNGFKNGGMIGLTRTQRGMPLSLVHEANVFRFADGGTKASYHSKRHHRFLSNIPTATMMTTRIQSKGARYRICSSSSQLLYSSSPIETSSSSLSSRRKTTAVYALILVSLLSFFGDNIMHLPVFRTLYLYHRNWRWWQPITSTFCHGDKAHLSGNVFLLLLFGRSVEDELGPIGLIFSYIFCGVVANFVSLAVLPKNTVSLGASGAVLGLFSVSIFSRLSWRDILDWRKIVEVGVLGQFVVSQFLNEAKTAAAGGIVGINHVAHLSGAGAGVAMVLILRKLIKKMESSATTSTTISS